MTTPGDSRAGRAPSVAILGCRGIPAQYGGFETFAEELSVRLVARGFPVTVFCQQPVWRPGQRFERDPPREHRGVRLEHVRVPRLGPRSALLYDLLSLRRARAHDVVYMLGYGAGAFLGLARRAGNEVWVNMDGLEWRRAKWGALARAWLRRAERAALRSAQRIVFDNAAVCRAVLGERADERVSVIEYGAELELEHDPGVLASLGLRPQAYFLCVARIEPENHVLEILRAHARSGVKRALLLVGDVERAGRYGAACRASAGPTARFLGALFDQRTLYALRRDAAAAVHGHSVGGTNPALLEAMAAGVPLLAHDNPFNREVLAQGALYFRGEEELVAALRQADAWDGAERARRGAAQRARIAARYTWERIADAYAALLTRRAAPAPCLLRQCAGERTRAVNPPRTFGRAALLVLLFACVYLPLEEFLLKWAPGGSTGYAVARIGFECLLYAAVAALAAARAARGLRQCATPLDLPLLGFLALASCSVLFSDGSLLLGLVNLRVVVRYVAVFYLVVFLELAPRERRSVLALLLGSAALQGVLGIVQHLQGGASDFWLPRTDLETVAGVTHEFAALDGGLEQGAVLGTTDHSVAFALFLLVGGTLAAALLLAHAVRGRLARASLVAVVLLTVAGCFASYVRSALFAFGAAVAVLAWMERRNPRSSGLWSRAAFFAPLFLAGLLLLRGEGSAQFAKEKETHVSPLASIEALFTSEYMQAARSSRLWVLGEVGGEILRTTGWLGFGPDQEYVKQRLLSVGGASLHRLIAYRAFEDVYWVALLAYFGFLGLGLFLLVLAKLGVLAWRARRAAREPWERAVAESVIALLLVLVPLSFLTPTFDFRTFSFYFWLLAGLVAASARPAARVLVRA